MYSSKKVGHALISMDKNGNFLAKQFNAPGGADSETPSVRPLQDIELLDIYGATRARAKTPDGTEMVSLRSVNFTDKNNLTSDEEDAELFLFSPTTSHTWKGNVFWGSNPNKNINIFQKRAEAEDDDIKEEITDLVKEKEEVGNIIKRCDIEVDNESVAKREAIVRRVPDQNTVMGESAIDAFSGFRESYLETFTPDARKVFEDAENAREYYRGGSLRTQPRPEWLHLAGFGLTHIDQNPQRDSNLVAAPKRYNTKMLTIERVIKWHALNRKSRLTGEFKTILDSDVMEYGYIKASINEKYKTVTVSVRLCPFVKFPQDTKPTDIMQTTFVTHNLLMNQTPGMTCSVKVEKSNEKRPVKIYNSSAGLMPISLSVSDLSTRYLDAFSGKSRKDFAKKTKSLVEEIDDTDESTNSYDTLESTESSANSEGSVGQLLVTQFQSRKAPKKFSTIEDWNKMVDKIASRHGDDDIESQAEQEHEYSKTQRDTTFESMSNDSNERLKKKSRSER